MPERNSQISTENLALWDRLGKTDPSQTKGFNRAGGFKGTAIKPIYTEQKMTETFGPCGIGWGINEPTFQTAPGSDGQLAVYCTVSIWVKQGDAVSAPIYGVGGDMVVVKQSAGLRTDDEAFKKAFTDAVGNAMKHLGMSADVHMGRFDDSKYVSELRAELAAEEAPPQAAPAPEPPKTLVKDQREIWAAMRDELDACSTLEELGLLWVSPAFKADFKKLKPDWAEQITEHKDARKAELAGDVKPRVPPNFEGMPA
jgi:hypothetical protein